MKYTELSIYTNTIGGEILGGVINAAGISCWSVEDPADLKALLDDNTVPYDYIEEGLLEKTGGETVVRVYIPAGELGAKQLKQIKDGAAELRAAGEFGSLKTEEKILDEEDWADSWKQYFHPLEIGKRFIVKPTWEDCDPAGRIILEIDPASSFGTGQHETTALCLRALENFDLEGRAVLDMGCGSGILGIAAAKCGAKQVVFADIDPVAAEIAEKNIAVNGVEAVCEVFCGNVISDAALAKRVFAPGFDLVLANIVADVIKDMAAMLYAALKPGGALVCSGIIGSRRGEVETALLNAGFTLDGAEEENDGTAIKCLK